LFVLLQVREMFHENGMLHGQLMTTKDRLKTAEAELEISQEKVAKLAAEVDENRKNESSSAIEMDNMKIVTTSAELLFFVNASAIAAAAATVNTHTHNRGSTVVPIPVQLSAKQA